MKRFVCDIMIYNVFCMRLFVFIILLQVVNIIIKNRDVRPAVADALQVDLQCI